MKKRLWTIMLSLVMALALLPAAMASTAAEDGIPCTGQSCSHKAEFDGRHYDTLDAALSAAAKSTADGDKTVTLLANIEGLKKSITVSGENIVLDLNGKTISGEVSTTGANGLINIASGAVVTITDYSTGETKGTIQNSGKGSSKAVGVFSGANLTLDGGVNLVVEPASSSASPLRIQASTSSAPTVTINNANLRAVGAKASTATAISFTNASGSYAANITINGGTFKSKDRDATLNFTTDGSNTNKIIIDINGGTFYNWLPGTNGGMVTDGRCLVVNADNSVTVQQSAPADYIAKATGTGSGKEIYLANGGDLYNLLNRAEIDKGSAQANGTVEIAKDVTCTYPGDDPCYGGQSEAALVTLKLDIAAGATLSGKLPLQVADVVVTGNGTVSENTIYPASDIYEVNAVTNDGTITYQGRIKAEHIVASVVLADGTTYNYTLLSSAVTAATSNAGSTLVLKKPVETDEQYSFTTSLRLDLNGFKYTYTDDTSAFHLNKNGASLEIVDNSEAGGGVLSAEKAPCAISNGNTRDDIHVTIGAGATIKGAVALFGERPTLDVYGTIDARGLTYEQDGETWPTYGIVTNGSTTEDSTINLHSGAKVYADSHAIYHPGTGTLNVYGGATVEGGSVGIEMRAGELNVYDGATITGGRGTPNSSPNGSGTTTVNAAVAVAQHTTQPSVVVNIYGGELSGGAALYESNPQKNNEDAVSKVDVNVEGGDFSAPEGQASIYSETQTDFVSGGSFSASVDRKYLDKNLTYEVKDGNEANTTPFRYTSTLDEALAAAGTSGTIQSLAASGSTDTYAVIVKNEGSSYHIEVAANEALPLPAAPTRTSHIFLGWLSSADGEVYQAGDVVTITADTTFTAQWQYIPPAIPNPAQTVNVSSSEGGAVTASPAQAGQGATVTLTVTPDEGYELSALTVTDAQGGAVATTRVNSGTYTFTMPGSAVTVRATFAPLQQEEPEPDEPAPSFTDVPAGEYYYEAVLWAVENGITVGTGDNTFSPERTVTRAEMVTFLWRAAGCPEPETSANPFTDISDGEYYYKAVLWAIENGITVGTGEDTFSPERTVTRAEAVTFQWRAAGTPAVSGGSFEDVSSGAYYASAVAWAVESGITQGTNSAGTQFSPETGVSRAQAVTFLYRQLG